MIILINLFILLFIPFIILGLIKKTKAFWVGRKGASIFQPLFDTIRLFKKERVISSSTSWIFDLAPVVIFTTTLFAGLFAPMIYGYSIINIEIAFVIFSYILGFGKFFALISAMDTASSFEGMGASREASFTTIIEPAFFIILASTIVLSGNYTFASINETLSSSGPWGYLITLFSCGALFIMLLVEASRVPVDDPNTHLELTMIHEVMVLDNGGVDLALISWASGMKMVILMSLIANFIIPQGLTPSIASLSYFALLALFAIMIGTIESAIARLRMSHVFEFVFIMSSLALVVVSLVTIKMFGN